MLNKYIDHHVHSHYSPDSQASLESIILKGLELGLDHIMITDHVEFDCPDPLFRQLIDYNAYSNKLKELKQTYKIELLMGVEIGYQPHVEPEIKNLVHNYPFDFVILSLHYCNGLDFCNKDFFQGKTPKQSYIEYFEAMKYMVSHFDDYDVVGHLDYIVRYSEPKDYNYEEHHELIDSILKIIIEKGKGLDINTSGFRYGLGHMHPKIEILKRYKDLGGKILTLGSDAHQSCHLQSHFKEAIHILKGIGFTSITHFKNRIPSYIEI